MTGELSQLHTISSKVINFVITVIEKITFERFVGTYTEDQSEVGVVIEMAGDQNASKRI
jgi:hypothetical protein